MNNSNAKYYVTLDMQYRLGACRTGAIAIALPLTYPAR